MGWSTLMRSGAMAPLADMSNSPIVPRRVAITGMSVATALGFDLDTFWRRLIAGECGIHRLAGYPDDHPLPTKIAGRIDESSLNAEAGAMGPGRSGSRQPIGARGGGCGFEACGVACGWKNPHSPTT